MKNESQLLPRQFGLLTAVSLIVGQTIGVGIFLTPAGMAKTIGSPFWLAAIWLTMGLMTLCGALCYAELAARFPAAGGSYVYLREAFGELCAFLYGWMVLLVLDPGLTAALAVGMSGYFAYLVPLSPFEQRISAISAILLLAGVNIAGARTGARVLQVLIFLKIGTLLLIIVWGFGGRFGDWAHFTTFFARRGNSDPLIPALAGGFVSAFFAFAGWWEVSRVAGEIKEPEKNLPRALTLGVGLITLIYLATSAVFFYLVAPEQVTNDTTFAAQAGEILFGKLGGQIFAAAVVVSVLGTLTAYLMVSPRVYYAMANDGLFFQSIARLHPLLRTPHRAILIQTLLASVLILTGSFNDIISYFFFVVVLFVALAVVGLFRLKKRDPNFSGYRTAFFPLPPIVFLLLSALVLILIALNNPLQTVIGAAVVLLGIPIYFLFFRRKI